MIDQSDKQTLPLIKNSRGRPKKGKALTPAEKQKRYRERLKENEQDLRKKIKTLEKEVRELKKELKGKK